MIGVPGQNRQGPVDLFQHKHPDELMRYGQGTKAKRKVRLAAQGFVKPVRAPDHEADASCSGVACSAKRGGKGVTGQAPAAFVQHDGLALWPPCADGSGFVSLAVFRAAGPAFGHFDQVRAGKPQTAGAVADPSGVAFAQGTFRTILETANGQQAKAHWSAGGQLGRAVNAPHLLEIVEGAHFGTEDVNDDIAAIDQHPVTMRHAFDLG